MPALCVRLLASILCLFLFACDEFPRDPRGTLDRIRRDKVLNVGVIHNPPWTDIRAQSPRGLEVSLVQRMAEELGAAPAWHIVDIDSAVQQLQRGELDLVIGGLLESSPYKEVGYTRPYIEIAAGDRPRQAHVMAIRRGENRWLITVEHLLDGMSASIEVKTSP